MEFADEVITKTQKLNHKTIIIAGFWANDILVKIALPENVKIIYYADEPELKKYAKDYSIPYFDGTELVKFSKEH